MPHLLVEGKGFPMGVRVELRAGGGCCQAAVDATQGATLLQLCVGGAAAVDVLPDSAPCFLMLPYSNRVQDALFTWKGKEYELPEPERHAIHGELRKREWQVVSQEESKVTLRFDTEGQDPPLKWPFPFVATAVYELCSNEDGTAGHLDCTLHLENKHTEDAPFGGGWHPYFPRHVGTGEDALDPVLTIENIQGVYPDAQGTRIPSGPLEPLPEALDFSKPRVLPPDVDFDCCCATTAGTSPVVTMEWPDEMRVRLFSPHHPEPVSHLVMYNPTERPFFAMEPVFNANNGINLFSQGYQGSGITVLGPGETLCGDMRIEWQLL